MEEFIVVLTSRGRIEVLMPVAAATLRQMARALVEMADAAIVDATVRPPGPPAELQNDQT